MLLNSVVRSVTEELAVFLDMWQSWFGVGSKFGISEDNLGITDFTLPFTILGRKKKTEKQRKKKLK